MRKPTESDKPKEATFSVSFRYMYTKHADACAYKDHVVITMPSDREWMSPKDAKRFASAILAAADRQEAIDAWNLKHRPDSYEGKIAKQRGRHKLKVKKQ